MSANKITNYGSLAAMVDVWNGNRGDISPDADSIASYVGQCQNEKIFATGCFSLK